MGACDNCFYCGRIYGRGPRCCLYMLMTFERRPCPPGEGCTVKVERTVNRRKRHMSGPEVQKAKTE